MQSALAIVGIIGILIASWLTWKYGWPLYRQMLRDNRRHRRPKAD